MRGLIVLLLVLMTVPALSMNARGDRLLEPPTIEPPVSTRERIIGAMVVLAEQMQHHIDTISFEQINLQLDPRSRTGKLRIGGDVIGDAVHLKLRSGIRFQHGYARFRAKVDLGLGSNRWTLKIPTFDVVPRTYGGRAYVEVRLPILRGRF